MRILSQSDYKKYRSCSQYHQGSKGRLQGSSISGCLANVYMLKIDKLISDFVVAHGGIYKI